MRTYFDKEFNPDNFSTTGGYYIDMDYPKLENTKVKIYDTNRWIGIGEHMVKDYIRLADEIILLFDLSKKEDFENIDRKSVV